MPNRNLLARFAAVGLVTGAAAAFAMGSVIETRLKDVLCAQLAARAADHVRVQVEGPLTGVDFEPPFAHDGLARLAGRLAPFVSRLSNDGSGIIRMHIFARDGTVIYSDLPAKVGQAISPTAAPLLAGALAGTIATKISSLDGPENSDLKERYGSALEVYVPVVIDGRVVGAYELYQDAGPLREITPVVWGTVAGGFGVLFLALFTIVWGAAAQMRRHQAEREGLARRAAEAEAAALRDLDQRKSEMLDVVSHELRTPLAVAHGYAELLHTRGWDAETAGRMAEEIYRGTTLMSRIIDDLLDFSRIQHGRLALNVREADLATVVRSAVQDFAGLGGGERIVADVPECAVPAWVDPDRVRQMVGNLLSNALRYAPAGEVHVRLATQPPGAAMIEVQDTGPGIRPEALPRIWEMFYRAPEATNSGVRGAGIGLTLVKTLAEAHGGAADVESVPGHGATFRVRLPLTRPRC